MFTRYESRACLQFMPMPAVKCLEWREGLIELLNGWQLEIVNPVDFYNERRHGTAWIKDHPDTDFRHAICFNLVKKSQTPELNIEEVCKAIAQHLTGIVEYKLNREGPKVHSMNFWDEGLPGELLDLRLQCYVVHYDD